jgi:PPOX class probable F420-dependent enzyme
VTPALPAWAAALLGDGRVGRLATADRSGRPLALPVCYVFDGEACWIPVDAKPKRHPERPLRRVRNVIENPRGALVVDHWDEDWRRLAWVSVEGPAEIRDTGPERAAAVRALLEKYPQYGSLGGAVAIGPVIRIGAERVRAWRWT